MSVKTIKIGNKEFDKNDFGIFINNHLEDYLRYARESGKFSKELSDMLRDEIYNAYNSDDEFDVTGYSSTNPNDFKNIEVTQNRFLRRDKKTEQGLTGKDSWLAHFIAKAGQTMTPYEKPKTGWDYDKHNLNAYFKGINLDAERIFSDYDLRPAETPDAIDGKKFKDRAELLYNYLKEYRERYIQDKNYNFTENDYDYDDYYLTDLDNLINLFETLSENEDENGNRLKTYNEKHNVNANDVATLLEKLGVDPTYIKAFTSNKFEFLTDEEKAALNAKKEEEEKKQESARLEGVKNLWNTDFWNLRDNNSFEYPYTPFTHYGHENFIDYYITIPTESWDSNTYGTYINLNDPDDIQGYWEEFLNFLKNPNNIENKYNKNNKDKDKYTNQRALLQLMFNSENRDNVFLDLGDGTYLIADSYTDNGYGAIYNPISGKVTRIYLGDHQYYNNPKIKSIYDKKRSNWIKDKYGDDEDYSKIFPQNPPPMKEGGLIKKYQEGSKFGLDIDYNVFNNAYGIQNRAKENNVSYKTQAEKERYISEKNKTLSNPNAGWTSKEKARLGYAIADLVSAGASFIPGAGTAVSAGAGLISTFGNLITDIRDDAVTGKEARNNFLLNLGMDAAGLIPGGGVASKMGKIFRTLKGTVPLIISLPGVILLLENSPEIAKSWKKAFDGSVEKGGEPMSYQDYMNVLQVLNVAAGAVNIGTNVYKSRKSSVVDDSSIAVEVRDSNNQKRALLLEGEDAKKFKEESNKSIEAAQEFLKTIEGGDKYTIVTDDVTVDRYGLKPWHKDSDGNIKRNLPYERITKERPVIMEVRKNKILQDINRKRTQESKAPKTPEKEIYAFGNQSIFGLGLRNKPDMWGDYLINMSNKPKVNNVLDLHRQTKNNELNSAIESSRKYKKKIDLDKRRVSKLKEVSTTYKEGELNTAKSELDSYNKKIENYNKSDFKKLDDIISKISNIDKKLKSSRTPEAQKATLMTEYLTLLSEKLKLESNLGKNKSKNYVERKKKDNKKMKQKVKELQNKIKEIKKIRSNFENRSSDIDKKIPTTNSSYFKSALNVKPTKVTINGLEYEIIPTKYKVKDVEYDFDKNTWNKEYLESLGLFKQGGSIDRNKLNKFLNYGKR